MIVLSSSQYSCLGQHAREVQCVHGLQVAEMRMGLPLNDTSGGGRGHQGRRQQTRRGRGPRPAFRGERAGAAARGRSHPSRVKCFIYRVRHQSREPARLPCLWPASLLRPARRSSQAKWLDKAASQAAGQAASGQLASRPRRGAAGSDLGAESRGALRIQGSRQSSVSRCGGRVHKGLALQVDANQRVSGEFVLAAKRARASAPCCCSAV